MIMSVDEAALAGAHQLPKPEDDPLAKKWGKRIEAARKHWEKLHKRIRHNRKVVAGFNWARDPNTQEFIDPRANLMFATMQATLPNVYARNPDVSVTGTWRNGQDVKLFCGTLETVLSRQLRDAKLKQRMKLTVLGAMMEYFGPLKITYQRDLRTDPIVLQRINDTQDNIQRLEALIRDVEEDDQRSSIEVRKRELETTLQGLQGQSEVVAAEGLVIDRILPENLLVDPAVVEFDDYENADWIAQVVPMTRGKAKERYGVDLSGAKTYESPDAMTGRVGKDGAEAITLSQNAPDDDQICILEIWDHDSQQVYTMAEGTAFFCRKPFSAESVGQRWYPFFLLPYAVLPGQFVAPCLVDLTEKLQGEYNETRDKFSAHRQLNQPGWVAASDLNKKSIGRYTDAVLGEVTLIDTEGRPLQQVIQPRPNVPIQAGDYDTSPIRSDWEQVTGLQDAARSVVVQPKTATEAGIMQQAMAGRTAEFRDKLEDLLDVMSQYSAQTLMLNMTAAQVARYTGPNEDPELDPMTGEVTPGNRAFEWPDASRDQIFDMVEVSIVSGTTGSPNKIQEQEIWAKLLPIVQPLVVQIMQLAAQHIDYAPLEALLRETLARLDDRIDVEQFLPAKKTPDSAAPDAGPAAAPLQPQTGIQPSQPDQQHPPTQPQQDLAAMLQGR